MSSLLPGVSASLLLRGQVFSHTNLGGEGEPELHPAVRKFFEELPAHLREAYVGYCAESMLVSDQLWGLDRGRTDGQATTLDEAKAYFAGASITAVKIRDYGDPEHGQPAQVCRSCEALVERLGIEVLEA